MGQEATPYVHVRGIHHIGFIVKNAARWARYFREVWGFEEFAYAGRSTGKKGVEQRVLRLGSIVILLTQPLKSNTPLGYWLGYHGEGVQDVALRVDDASTAYDRALKLGAHPAGKPLIFYDEHDPAKIIMSHAVIEGPGDILHTLIASDDYMGVFAPAFVAVDYPAPHASPAGLHTLDHLVWNVEEGNMDVWASFYKRVFGFKRLTGFSEEQISTGRAALRSVVMRSPDGNVTMPINEPVKDKFSHIDESLRDCKGPCVQHAAFLTENIFETVTIRRQCGVQFLLIPHTYYVDVRKRFPELAECVNFDILEKLNILIDKDEQGYLLQIFTKTILGSFFIEIIQRCGSDGFGVGNFLRLFEAIERAAGRLK